MTTRAVSVALSLAGVTKPFVVVGGRVVEGISELSSATVEIAAEDDLELEQAIGGAARLSIALDGVAERRFSLKVGAARFLGLAGGALRHVVELRAPVWFLRHTRDTRKFRGLSAQDIISQVLAEHEVPFAFRTMRQTPVRKYCTQYRESNLDFALRLLEFEGIYYTLDEDGLMVLEDRSPDADPVAGPTSRFYLLDAASALNRDELGIHALVRGARVASGKATVSDFNWKKPRLELLRSAAAELDAELETYDYPAGYRRPDQGEHLARVRLEAQRVPSRYVEGRGDVPSFAPGRRITVDDLDGELPGGALLLTAVEHVFHDPRFVASDPGLSGTTYENRFRAIPLAVPFRPPLRTPRPTIEGCHTAMVRGPQGAEIHTDRYGRLRAQFHWDRQAKGTDDDSRWIRMLQETATGMVISRVGWEVSVAYIDGDPDRPIGLARNINGVMVPSYEQPANQHLMTIKTPSSPATGGYNELKLDDTAGAMLFRWRAERDMVTVVRNDRTQRVGRDETRDIGLSLTRQVERDQSVTIGRDATTVVGAHALLDVRGDRTKTVGGSEDIRVGSQVNESTTGNETETVGSVRLTVAGNVGLPDPPKIPKVPTTQEYAAAAKQGALAGLQGALQSGTMGGLGDRVAKGAVEGVKGIIPTPQGVLSNLTYGLSDGVTLSKVVDMLFHGSINRTAEEKTKRTVGGAFVSVAASNISTSARRYAELVGGAKITCAATGSVSQTATGPLVATAGGAVLRTAGGDIGYGARFDFVTVGGGASFAAGEKLELRSSDIVLEATSSIVIDVAGLVIDMKPDAITMKGPLRLESGGTVKVTGSDDNITA